MRTLFVAVAAIAISLACKNASEHKQETPAGAKAECQVSGSCKACTQTTDCPSGEICTTFPIGDGRYSGCVTEHGCSASAILTQAAEKCGTANPISGTAPAPAGSAAK